uniref:Inhibitor of growth protein N-terminal histone-binding domain-containing protein n=1 Tax=Acrobeloides nanus TaxID=290746 RepID=A0A914CR59_9BILA
MHYLEDDIELLETLPPELKAQCCEMRDIDSRIEKGLAHIREASREFFDAIDNLTAEERETRYQKIKADYSMVRELSEEKVHIAEFLHTMMEKYGDRVSKDLSEFKCELEADSPGVTAQIEQEFIVGVEDLNNEEILFEDKFLPSTSRMNGHGTSKGLSTPELLLANTSMRSRSSTATSLENMPPPKV